MLSIFLSHSSRDKEFVRRLRDRLERSGVKVWLDETEFGVGDPLIEKIGEVIDGIDFVGVVLSHNSVDSGWVQQELRMAMQKESEERRIVVLPLLFEPVEIPLFLRHSLHADFTTPDKFETAFALLLKTLGVETEYPPPATSLPWRELWRNRLGGAPRLVWIGLGLAAIAAFIFLGWWLYTG